MKSFTKIQNEKDITTKQYVAEQNSLSKIYTTFTPENGVEGKDYAVTVPGLTTLEVGTSLTIIPHVNNINTSTSLTVNDFGLMVFARSLSDSFGTKNTTLPANKIQAGFPIEVIYRGNIWVTKQSKPVASDINGTLSILNGGTGAITASKARTNLGAAAAVHTHTTSDITDLDTIVVKQEEKGAAGGVASLGADGKIVETQLPDMDYIPTSEKGNANGVAILGEDAKIPVTELPIIPIANGGTGASTASIARANLGVGPGKRVARFTVGTSTSGWTADQVDYLCDGTDDQVEINAAITALPSTGGEVVILDGTYNLTGSIKVNKNYVTLSGNGQSTILKRAFEGTDSELGLIDISSTNNTIRFLSLDGVKSTYSGSKNNGIYIYAKNNNTIIGNTLINNYYGIYNRAGNYNNIILNTFTENVDGVNIASSYYNTVTGNNCISNTQNGIFLGNSCKRSTITGNISSYNSNTGIFISFTSDSTVTGNVCNGNIEKGIYLSNNSNNNTVTGNTCNENKHGIEIYSSSNNTVTGNTCNNNSTSGIYLYGSSNNMISGNTCLRGTGKTTDYNSGQETIRMVSGENNLVIGNNIMGKNYIDSGTNNTFANNKYN